MNQKNIYALGFFDGIHRGHGALMDACRELAAENGCGAGVVTFQNHPDALVLGRTPPLLNTSQDRRKLLLERFRMDTVVELPFDKTMMTMPWQDFFRMLLEKYDAAGLVCGHDFRFGDRGRGTPESLIRACQEVQIPCVVVPKQIRDGQVISSTYIRSLIEQGQMERAVDFLGHPHVLTGIVRPGQHLGRTIGVPTANLEIPEGILVPRLGVYACRVELDGNVYCAVTNVGRRPTVGGRHITVEPWILGYDGDLYGREITLEFYSFLRPEQKFPSLDAMVAEIRKNALQTEEYFREK